MGDVDPRHFHPKVNVGLPPELGVRQGLDLDLEGQDELDIFILWMGFALTIDVGVLGGHLDTPVV